MGNCAMGTWATVKHASVQALQVKEVAHLKNCEIPFDDSKGGAA